MKKIRKMFFIIYLILLMYIVVENLRFGTYSDFGFFTTVFSLPYSLLVYWISIFFGGYYFVGVVFGVMFSSFIITPTMIRSEFQSKKLGDKRSEMAKIQEGTLLNEDGEKMTATEFLSKEKINPLAPFITILMMPILIMRIRGVAYIPMANDDVFENLRFWFFWFDLRGYDPYLILTTLVLITFKRGKIKTFIIKMTGKDGETDKNEEIEEKDEDNQNKSEKESEMDENEEIEEKDEDNQNKSKKEKEMAEAIKEVIPEHLKRLMGGLVFFILSASILNPVLGIFVISNLLFSKIFYKRMKKEIGGEYEGLVQKTGL